MNKAKLAWLKWHGYVLNEEGDWYKRFDDIDAFIEVTLYGFGDTFVVIGPDGRDEAMEQVKRTVRAELEMFEKIEE